MLHCNSAGNRIKDENEDCSQMPNEGSTCDGRVVGKPQESEPSELAFVSVLTNQILASSDPNEHASSSGDTANGRVDEKDVSCTHQNEASHFPKIVQGYHENSGMITDTVEPNSQASVVSASSCGDNTLDGVDETVYGALDRPHECNVCGRKFVHIP